MADDQLDEWTPQALANYDAAHADGVTPLGGIRAYIVTEDLLDGPDSIDVLLDPDADGAVPWTREVGVIFLPTEGTVGMTEGFHFG